jgi:hypothetical protein
VNPRAAIITVTVTGITPVTVTVSQEGTVGMPERISGNILVYPNPNHGRFSIITADHSYLQMDVELFTMDGKSLKTAHFSGSDSYSFDFSDKPKGSYLIRIATLDGTTMRKIVVE